LTKVLETAILRSKDYKRSTKEAQKKHLHESMGSDVPPFSLTIYRDS